MEPDPIPSDVPNSGSDDARRRRILFRATHRGTRETDILIGGFVLAGLYGFSPEELDQIEEVMELLDVDLAEWLTGRQPIPSASDSPMLRRIERAAQETALATRRARIQAAEQHASRGIPD